MGFLKVDQLVRGDSHVKERGRGRRERLALIMPRGLLRGGDGDDLGPSPFRSFQA